MKLSLSTTTDRSLKQSHFFLNDARLLVTERRFLTTDDGIRRKQELPVESHLAPDPRILFTATFSSLIQFWAPSLLLLPSQPRHPAILSFAASFPFPDA